MKQEWLLSDLHLHSYYSKINKPSESGRVKKMTAEEYVEILREKKVRIFSITDHNYFSKKFYDEIDDYINNKQSDMRVINGVEFDVEVFLNDGTTDYIHICVYLDNNVDRTELENAVNSLYKDDSGNQIKPKFIDILNSMYNLKTKFIVIPHGDKARGLFKKNKIDSLDFNDVADYYKYAMYKIFNAFDVSPSFFEKSEQFWASTFCEKTKKFEMLTNDLDSTEIDSIKKNISSKIRDKDFVLSNKEEEIYKYIIEYGAYFTYFNFSDWHNAEEYNPSTNNFIFGRINTAFESLEMATLDPISRIIKSQDLEIQIPSTILSRVNFKIDNKLKTVELSPGLNAIVGKRGSGKTLFLSVIRNLVDKNDSIGALNKYKKLHISDISAENRGGIKISIGGLSSVAFLTQDEIKDVFENPDNAQKTISNYFINIKDIDMSKINNIVSIGEKIQPINENYKNITSNILAIKKFNDYNYSNFELLDDGNIKINFTNAITNIKNIIKETNKLGLDTEEIENKLYDIEHLKSKYLYVIQGYNDIISKLNNSIANENSKRTNNQITQRQNMKDIKNALSQINKNFEIQLNFEKIKTLLNNFTLENPTVEIFQKGKYLFVTYYEIPDNIKELLIEQLTSSIVRGNSFEDVYAYIFNHENKKLKANETNLVSNLKKYVNNNDIFIAKKEFYEIKNNNIDFKKEITTMEELKNNIENNNIFNLTYASPGTKSVAYLDMLFDLEETILILDQPEDNIDNDYISNYLVPNIKRKKKIKQLIFVTHNPSVAVYGDAFNYVFTEINSEIDYKNYFIENIEDKEQLIKILEGGKASFSNRNKKFGNVLGEEEYGNN